MGVPRVLGFQKSMVSFSFLVETSFVVGMGCIWGTLLGILLARNLFAAGDTVGDAAFIVPWPLLTVMLTATLATALLMTWIPSCQAASVALSEALRYE